MFLFFFDVVYSGQSLLEVTTCIDNSSKRRKNVRTNQDFFSFTILDRYDRFPSTSMQEDLAKFLSFSPKTDQHKIFPCMLCITKWS